MNYKEILYKQLALDFSVEPEDITSRENLFVEDKRCKGRRSYEWDDAILKIVGINNKFIMAASDLKLLDALKKSFKSENGGFISRFDNLYLINKILTNFGHRICDCHHYYIPKKDVTLSSEYKTRLFEKEELLQFKGNADFKNALEFSALRPDMLGICAYDGEKIIGMAAASRDSEAMWQIGINVCDKYKGKGVGAYIVNLLKEEIIRRGILPFYGTVESHISSQRIALKCGFIPYWWQLYTKET